MPCAKSRYLRMFLSRGGSERSAARVQESHLWRKGARKDPHYYCRSSSHLLQLSFPRARAFLALLCAKEREGREKLLLHLVDVRQEEGKFWFVWAKPAAMRSTYITARCKPSRADREILVNNNDGLMFDVSGTTNPSVFVSISHAAVSGTRSWSLSLSFRYPGLQPQAVFSTPWL